MESGNGWKAGGVSVAGFSHLDADIPCQDAHAYKLEDDGWFIGAVADGAGSARLSHIGAEAFINAVLECNLHDLPSKGLDPDGISNALIKIINDTKEELLEKNKLAEDGTPTSITDFAATLIVVVANHDGGAFFHVGDGSGSAFYLGDIEGAIVSKPENGEYANETYFVTMKNWETHLRVTTFGGDFDTILLMSDGVTPMAMSKGCSQPFDNFVNPVIEFVRNADNATGDAALINTLSNEKVRSVTGDDKTLVWAAKPHANPSD